MTWTQWISRWWAHRRLRRGRCQVCNGVLPDDVKANYCSEDCASSGLW